MGIYLLISNSLFFPFVKPFVLKMPFSIVVEISMSIVAEISLYTCGNNLFTRGNILVYSWKYLCKLVEILRRTIWRVVCAQECPANCKPVADIVFMHLLPLPARLQKRPNWGIKHNKSQNSRANFSGERGEMALLCICWCSCAYTWCGVECRCLCLHLEKKGTLEDSGVRVGGIRANYFRELYPLSTKLLWAQPQHVFK